MASKLSVLQNFRSEHLRTSPFPYLVIDNTLPEKVYAELSQTFPPETFIFEYHRGKQPGNTYEANTRYDLPAAHVKNNPDLELGLWREFSEYHTSQEFLDEFLSKLGDVISQTHLHILAAMQKKSPVNKPRAGTRFYDDEKHQSEIALDCQIAINSPPKIPETSVRTAHLDNPVELFAGLFYLRHPDDRSHGGDLDICTWKTPARKRIGPARIIDANDVVVTDSVSYGANKFALFINSLESIHGVTTRDVTDQPRRLANIIGEVYPTQKRVFSDRRYREDKSVLRQVRQKLFGVR